MTNTIELLEVIGRDASLRHASGHDLSQALSGMQASEELRRAAISGDEGYLLQELGHREVRTTNTVNNGIGGGSDGESEDGASEGTDQEDPGKPE